MIDEAKNFLSTLRAKKKTINYLFWVKYLLSKNLNLKRSYKYNNSNLTLNFFVTNRKTYEEFGIKFSNLTYIRNVITYISLKTNKEHCIKCLNLRYNNKMFYEFLTIK